VRTYFFDKAWPRSSRTPSPVRSRPFSGATNTAPAAACACRRSTGSGSPAHLCLRRHPSVDRCQPAHHGAFSRPAGFVLCLPPRTHFIGNGWPSTTPPFHAFAFSGRLLRADGRRAAPAVETLEPVPPASHRAFLPAPARFSDGRHRHLAGAARPPFDWLRARPSCDYNLFGQVLALSETKALLLDSPHLDQFVPRPQREEAYTRRLQPLLAVLLTLHFAAENIAATRAGREIDRCPPARRSATIHREYPALRVSRSRSASSTRRS